MLVLTSYQKPKPVSASSSTTINNATAYGPACYQQSSTAGSGGDLGNALGLVAGVQAMQFFGAGGSGSADECLSVNVITPAGQTAASAVKLPVVVWICKFFILDSSMRQSLSECWLTCSLRRWRIRVRIH